MLSPWEILEHFTQTLHPHLLFYMSEVDYSVAPPPRSTAEERWLDAGLLCTKGRKPFSSTYLLTKLLRLLPNPLRIRIVGKQKLPIWTDASLHIRCQSCVMLPANHPKCCRAFVPWQNRLRGLYNLWCGAVLMQRLRRLSFKCTSAARCHIPISCSAERSRAFMECYCSIICSPERISIHSFTPQLCSGFTPPDTQTNLHTKVNYMLT